MAERRIVWKYSESFKRQVVSDLESARFDTVGSAMRHYGIPGNGTIERWIRKFGKNHLLPKVVIVQTPNEKREIERLRKDVAKLEQALGRAHVEGLLEKKFLELACRDLGTEVDAFKKKVDGKRPTKSPTHRR